MNIRIIDYPGGTRHEYGPFVSIEFKAVNTTVPKVQDDTVSFRCQRPDGDTEDVTVGICTHSITPCQSAPDAEERKDKPMTDAMKEALSHEIDLINEWIAYVDTDELELMTTLAEAQEQLNWMDDYLSREEKMDPATMLIVWNYCVSEAKARARAEELEESDN